MNVAFINAYIHIKYIVFVNVYNAYAHINAWIYV